MKLLVTGLQLISHLMHFVLSVLIFTNASFLLGGAGFKRLFLGEANAEDTVLAFVLCATLLLLFVGQKVARLSQE